MYFCWAKFFITENQGIKNLKSSLRDHSFTMQAKFFEKLTCPTPLACTCTCAYQGLKNLSFSENFAHLLKLITPG